jgi:hypothetical protein
MTCLAAIAVAAVALTFDAMPTFLLERATRLASLEGLERFTIVTIGLLSLTALVLLFLMRRKAVSFFIAALALNLTIPAVDAFSTILRLDVHDSFETSALFSAAALAGMFFYSSRLESRGLLR